MLIKLKNLVKKYNNIRALNEFSFTFSGNKIYGLVGPNGAGKTTLLKTAAQLLKLDAGSIKYEGIKKHKLNYISERPDLFPLLTVKEHFKFLAMAHDLKDWQQKAEFLLNEFSLDNKENSFPHELSKGMKQKVVLSLSLLMEPEVILFDEPFSGLDPQAVKDLKKLIFEFKKQERIIIISSHNLNAIYDLSDCILFIKEGKLVKQQSKEGIIQEMQKKDYIALEDLFLEVMADESC